MARFHPYNLCNCSNAEGGGRGDYAIGALRSVFTCCGLMKMDIALFREVGDTLANLIDDEDFQPMPTDIAAAFLLLYRMVHVFMQYIKTFSSEGWASTA